MQSIRAGTQTAPRSAPPVEGSDSGERFSDFQELALRGPPVCARCGAEDGDYGFDCTTKRLICTVCAQNLILSDNDTSWQHLSLQHRKARERMLIGSDVRFTWWKCQRCALWSLNVNGCCGRTQDVLRNIWMNQHFKAGFDILSPII